MRTLAHLRDPRMGARIWAGARYITPGPTRTVQLHDSPEAMLETGMTRQTQLGSDVTPAHYVDTPDYPVKQSVAGSLFVSDPRVFQSYFKVRWDDMFGMRANLSEGTRRLSPLPNPNARGRAEGQAIMSYNPWPSAGQLNPEYPASELKAL